jgi:tetratricopeptide (TPR) repeat protein
VALEGYDPAIVGVISQARAEVEAGPRSAAAWGKLATLLYVHDVRAEADGCFAQAERLDPRDARWPYLRARSLAIDNPDLAVPHLRRAVALLEQKGDVPAAPRLVLAEHLVHKGDVDEAEAHFRRVADRSPADARALLGLGRVAVARGDLPAALAWLNQSARQAPRTRATLVLLASVQQQSGDRPAAQQTLKQLARAGKEPDWPDPIAADAFALQTGLQASLLKARDLLAAGRASHAAAVMQAAVRSYPDSDAAWLYLGRARVRDGRLSEADKALRTCLRLAPDSVEGQVQLGVALHLRGRHAEAAGHFRRAVELKPELAEAHYNHGLALVEMGDLARGSDELRAAVQLRPDLTDAHIALGAALVRRGQTSEGAGHLREALRLSPDDERARSLVGQLDSVHEAAPPAGRAPPAGGPSSPPEKNEPADDSAGS